MKKYNTPICTVMSVSKDDIMNLSGEVAEPKFGMVFEMIEASDDSSMGANF